MNTNNVVVCEVTDEGIKFLSTKLPYKHRFTFTSNPDKAVPVESFRGESFCEEFNVDIWDAAYFTVPF